MAILFLVIEKGAVPRRQVSLVVLPHVLGRLGHADTGFEGSFISRKHAEIVERGDSLMIRDLKSENGTFVNGQRVDESGIVLEPGDLITLGLDLVVLRVQSDDETLHQVGAPAGAIRVDLGTREVWVNEKLLSPELPRKEFEILRLLASSYRHVYSNKEISRVGWPERPNDVSDQEIQQQITRLRRRIKPVAVENRKNFGYRLI